MKLRATDTAALKQLVSYSFTPIGWKWEDLTETEKKIVPDQATLDRLKQWSLALTKGVDYQEGT